MTVLRFLALPNQTPDARLLLAFSFATFLAELPSDSPKHFRATIFLFDMTFSWSKQPQSALPVRP